jgi:hypothetical protein
MNITNPTSKINVECLTLVTINAAHSEIKRPK